MHQQLESSLQELHTVLWTIHRSWALILFVFSLIESQHGFHQRSNLRDMCLSTTHTINYQLTTNIHTYMILWGIYWHAEEPIDLSRHHLALLILRKVHICRFLMKMSMNHVWLVPFHIKIKSRKVHIEQHFWYDDSFPLQQQQHHYIIIVVSRSQKVLPFIQLFGLMTGF